MLDVNQTVHETLTDIFGKSLFPGRDFFTGQISDSYSGSGLEGAISDTFHGLKILSFFLTVTLAVVLVVVMVKLAGLYGGKLSPKKIMDSINPPTPTAGGGVAARWDEIIRHIDSVKETEWRYAIMEADKLVDHLLQKAGFQGDTMGERLKGIAPGTLLSVQNLWDAHKIRNLIAHETGYTLRYAEARDAIRNYEKALRELGVL